MRISLVIARALFIALLLAACDGGKGQLRHVSIESGNVYTSPGTTDPVDPAAGNLFLTIRVTLPDDVDLHSRWQELELVDDAGRRYHARQTQFTEGSDQPAVYQGTFEVPEAARPLKLAGGGYDIDYQHSLVTKQP